MQFFLDDPLPRRRIVVRVLPKAEGDVFSDRHRIEEGRVLKNHPHMAAHLHQLVFIISGNIRILKENMTFGRLLQTDDEAQDRALAGTAGTEDGQGFPLMNV